jgi:hypothetical protein
MLRFFLEQHYVSVNISQLYANLLL